MEDKGSAAAVAIPAAAAAGDQLHVIVKAEAGGHYRLAHYRRVIITIR